MRTLYLRPRLVSAFPGCAVLHVTALLRELILETVRLGRLRARNRHERALRDILALHLEKASPMPTSMTLPKERRARVVAEAVLNNPADPRPLSVLCSEAGVGVRTIERTFQKEVGTGFASWKRQVRLMKAVELLVSGRSTKEVAFTIGYRQPSAFVEIFRQTFGTPPKAWISTLEKLA